MAKLTKAEQELHVYKAADEEHFTIYTTDPVYMRLFRRLIERTGGSEDHRQGGIYFSIPAGQLVFAAKKKLTLTEDQRAKRISRIPTVEEK